MGCLRLSQLWGKGFDDENDNLSVSCKPTALVLFNPGIDVDPEGLGYDRVGGDIKIVLIYIIYEKGHHLQLELKMYEHHYYKDAWEELDRLIEDV